MTTPAKRHADRHAAIQAAKSAPAEKTSTEEFLRRALIEDRRRLKEIQSVQAKAGAKLVMLEKYRAWIEGILAADTSAHDDITATLLLWYVDTDQLAQALPILAHLIRHKLTLGGEFKRTPATAVAEDAADLALTKIKLGQPVDPTPLAALAEITADQDMPDPVRARLLKAAGLAMAADPSAAADAHRLLTAATGYDAQIGVKGELARLSKILGSPAET